MQPMTTIRTWHIGQMKNAMNTLQFIVNNITEEDAKSFRDGGDGWTVLEVMAHLRDFEAVFIERAQMTLAQDNPKLPFPDHEQLVIDNKYNDGILLETFEIWQRLRKEFIKIFEAIDEAQWERPAVHPKRGNFTLNDQLLLTVWHDMNHMEQIARIMLEKK